MIFHGSPKGAMVNHRKTQGNMYILAVGRPMMDQDGLLMFVSTILGSLGAILGPSGGHFGAILVLSWGDLWVMMPSVGSMMATR